MHQEAGIKTGGHSRILKSKTFYSKIIIVEAEFDFTV